MAPRHKRTLLAVLFAPVLGATAGLFALGVLSTVTWFVRYSEVFPALSGGFWAIAMIGAFVGGLFGIPAMVIAGRPAHALVYNHGLRSPLIYALAGALAGLPTALAAGQLGILFLVNSDLPAGEEPLSDLTSAVWVFPQAALLGACCASCFWLIPRPDRDAANPPTPTP